MVEHGEKNDWYDMYWPGFYQQNYDYESPGTTGSIFLVLEVYRSIIEMYGFLHNLRNLVNKLYYLMPIIHLLPTNTFSF